MSGRYTETLHKQLGALPKALAVETPGEHTIESIARLRVDVSEFLNHNVKQEDLKTIERFAYFKPDNSLTFTGISIPTLTGDIIELGHSPSKVFEFGVTLIGSQVEKKGKGGIEYVEQQQWLIPYTSSLYAEIWYAGPRYRWFTILQDTAKLAQIELPLQKLFLSGQQLWHTNH